MTLKQLIKECDYKSTFNILYKSHFLNWDEDRVRKMDIGFFSTWNELSRLDSKKDLKDNIYIVNTKVENSSEQIFDICYMSNKKEDKGELYAIDFIDWSDLINLEIIDGFNFNSNVEMLAHILYEMTFWGFSNKEVQGQSNKLKSSVEGYKDEPV